MNRERTEDTVQIAILILIGAMAGAASFTHVHDWTMANSWCAPVILETGLLGCRPLRRPSGASGRTLPRI
jgi:hypothetical protein